RDGPATVRPWTFFFRCRGRAWTAFSRPAASNACAGRGAASAAILPKGFTAPFTRTARWRPSWMISMPGTLLFMTEAVPMALVDLRRLGHRVRRALRRPVPGRFQPYAHTAPDRYPWLFRFAAEQLGDGADRRLLSFGCSRGDEVVSLRRHFPSAFIKGLDISPRNIAACRKRGITRAEFAVASSTEEETEATYDAV